jgi:excisionase family DNA binding protein
MTAAHPEPGNRLTPSKDGGASVPKDAVFTIDDLVIYLKLPKSTVYKLAQEGKIPGQKVGRHWRFRRDTIDRWLDTNAKGDDDE